MLERPDAAIGRRFLEIKSLDKRVEANGLLFRDWGSTPHGSIGLTGMKTKRVCRSTPNRAPGLTKFVRRLWGPIRRIRRRFRFCEVGCTEGNQCEWVFCNISFWFCRR